MTAPIDAGEVVRYDPTTKYDRDGDFNCVMAPEADGDYVTFTDYAALRERAEKAEAEVARLNEALAFEQRNLGHATEVAARLRKDAERMAWIDANTTLHLIVEFLYVVDGYECRVSNTRNGWAFERDYHGDSLRDAIDAAINGERTHEPRDRFAIDAAMQESK